MSDPQRWQETVDNLPQVASLSELEVPIPRDPRETSLAYNAKVIYCQLGPRRGGSKVSAVMDSKNRRMVEQWRSQFNWVETAKAYDEEVARRVSALQARDYMSKLEAHRTHYGEAGAEVRSVALDLLQQFKLSIPNLEITPQTLAVVVKALTSAADLEAHSLSIDRVLPRLEDGN